MQVNSTRARGGGGAQAGGREAKPRTCTFLLTCQYQCECVCGCVSVCACVGVCGTSTLI